MDFEVIGTITAIELIASGQGIRERRRLQRMHGKGRLRKRKGIATVRLADGTIHKAETHWYEAHGIGRKEAITTESIRGLHGQQRLSGVP
jgi:hypothetical protein